MNLSTKAAKMSTSPTMTIRAKELCETGYEDRDGNGIAFQWGARYTCHLKQWD